MMLSIVICTYNRCAYLKETLASLAAQSEGATVSAEIVVVDNNSTDDTAAMIREQAPRFRWPVVYVVEKTQGVGHARNAGARASKGEIVAYVDDDVLVEPDWLENLVKAFNETDADVIGGRIERHWECDVPEWFSEEIGAPVIRQDYGAVRKVIEGPDKYLLTANLAFRRVVFEKLGLFQPNLGRRANVLIGGEEPEMFQRLHAAGVKILYEPAAVVRHRVETNRMTQVYMRRWFYDIGRTKGHQTEWKASHILTILPGWEWREFCRALKRWFQLRRGHVPEQFAAEMWVRYHLGFLKERMIHWLPLGIGRRFCVFKHG